MNTRNPNELSIPLARCVDDLRASTPAESLADAAQSRLLQRVSQVKANRAPRAIGWWVAAAASACLVLAISVVPLLDNGTGVAFAQVQQRFSAFNTLTMSMQQHIAGVEQQTTVLVAADGRTRVDIGDQLSVVIDPVQGRGMNLLHGPKQAVRFGFEPGESPQGSDALQWLQQIRDFQGEAEALPGSREIDGVQTRGWALQLDDMSVTLWASDDGWPVSMTVGNGEALAIDFGFRFDAVIDEAQWRTELPAGYAEAGADTDG